MTPCRSNARIDADQNVEEFIRHCREDLTWPTGRENLAWNASEWPFARWVKVSVGKRKGFDCDELLDARFVEFAKSYFRYKNTDRPTQARRELPALRCLEAALLTATGSGSVQGLSFAVLDEAAAVTRNHFTPQVRYQIGKAIKDIAQFLTDKRLVPMDLSTWKSPLRRPLSGHRTGRGGRAESKRKLPSQAGLDAMAEVFANNPADPQTRFVSSLWTLLMAAPWRSSEVLALHVDAEYEEQDDQGVVSYGLRYYGKKGFEYDVKWIPKVMEPAAREAFRRIKEMTATARALARHLEDTPDRPFLYSDAPTVGVDDEMSLDEKAA